MPNDKHFSVPVGVAYALTAACLGGILWLQLTPAFLAGLLAFALTKNLMLLLVRVLPGIEKSRPELLAVGLVALASLAAAVGIGMGLAQVLNGESLQDLLRTVSDALDQSRRYLPADMAAHLPGTVVELKEHLVGTLKGHADTLAGVGTHALHGIVVGIVGWIAGIMAAVRHTICCDDANKEPAFSAAWSSAWSLFETSFEKVAFAQIKISAVNAVLSGIFLLGIMPALGWPLPYAKTLVLVTFIAGLLPVVGNLVSNTLVCSVALGISLPAAAASLLYLVVIHKLEYFTNSKIIGGEIGTKAWEILIVLFAFETLFGIAGMVAAPVCYAYAKAELRRWHWLP